MIDDDIHKALKVDPSPEFLARVRTRIAEEPEPSAWRWSWSLAGVAALAAAVVIAAIVSRPVPHVERPDVAQAFKPAIHEPDVVQAFGPATSEESTTAGLKPRTPSLKPRTTSVDRSALSEERTEVLIDPREREALLQLILGVRTGRIDLAAAQDTALRPPMELGPVTEIVITPITIDPLAPLSGAEGVRP